MYPMSQVGAQSWNIFFSFNIHKNDNVFFPTLEGDAHAAESFCSSSLR